MNAWTRLAVLLLCSAVVVEASLPLRARGDGAAPLHARGAGAAPLHARGEGAARRGHGGSITQGLDCSACHDELGWDHVGDQAGGGFDHARTGFPLTGRHRQAACTDCHAQGVDVSRDCASCHQDPHERRLGQDCSACHSARSFAVTDVLEKHRQTRLPLTGMHALLDCTECHRRGTDASFTGLPANCYGCHARDYRRSDIHPTHTGTAGDPGAPPFPTDCAQCHRATGWSPAVVAPSQLRMALASAALTAPPRHELVFPIGHGPHRGAQCADCHLDSRRPALTRCNGCHVHDAVQLRKQHDRPVGARARDCLGCHPGGSAR